MNEEQNIPVQETCNPYQQAADPPYFPPERQRVRRVGTVTMGVALVVSGVMALIYLFNSSFDFVTIAKLAPLFLVMLGGEIIISHLIFPNDRLKYDFISGFFCFVIMCGSIGAILLVPAWQQYGPGRDRATWAVDQEVQDLCYDRLKGYTEVGSLEVSVFLQGLKTGNEEVSAKNLRPGDEVRIHLELLGDYPDKESFAQACRKVLDGLDTTGVRFSAANISSRGAGPEYTVELGNRFKLENTTENLVKYVEE